MKSPDEARLDTVVAGEEVVVAEEQDEAVAAAGGTPSSARPPAGPKGRRSRADSSEEAIPERDPSYRLPDATAYELPTVDHLPAAERRALARRLEELGMSRARATVAAWL
jgi:hypothetical protein